MSGTMQLVRVAALLLSLFFLGGCASSGPKFAELVNTIPGVSEGQGRIYFYRDRNIFGAALQPDIKLNGEPVGSSQPGSFFYVDRPAGEHEVSTRTEAENIISFLLKSGETLYVRTYASLGILIGRVYPELVEREAALSAISDLHYIGSADLAVAKPATREAGQPTGDQRARQVGLDDLKDLLPQ